MREIFLLLLIILILKIFFSDIAHILEQTILQLLQLAQKVIASQSGNLP